MTKAQRPSARFVEASSIVGDRSGRGTDDLVMIPRRASSTVMSRSMAKSTRSFSAAASIVAPPPSVLSAATSDAVSSPCRPAVISIRPRSTSASTRITSAVAPRRSTSAVASRRSTSAVASWRSTSAVTSRRSTSAVAPQRSTSAVPSARRARRRIPSPVDEEAVYITHEDAVSSDGEGTPSDDMPAQMAAMRREMAAMQCRT